MGGPTGSIRYRQHSSQDHVTTQAPPLRQSSDPFEGEDSNPGTCIAVHNYTPHWLDVCWSVGNATFSYS